MTLEDWLGSHTPSDLHNHFWDLPDRKLHLLTAAFLRRVWDGLPSDHTRSAVEATELYADNLVSARELARLRSTDLLETCEALWIDPNDGGYDEQLIGMGCLDCPVCDARAAEYECRAAKSGGGLSGVASAIEAPAWIAVQAALRAREVVLWKSGDAKREGAVREEAEAQYDLYCEIVGAEAPNVYWPRWRTIDVRSLARHIHGDQAFELLPILADALQDAGCNDGEVLSHCREGKNHVRGCWVVDLALGTAGI